jgi:hypothetical protein
MFPGSSKATKPFLELARSVEGRILVNGNKKHFPPEICRGVIVMSPSEFIHVYLNDQHQGYS